MRRRRTVRRRRDPASRLGQYKHEAQQLWHMVRFGKDNKLNPVLVENARSRLVEILRATGHVKLAQGLARHRGKIYGTLFGEKLDRAIHGVPQSRAIGWPRPQKAKQHVWIARLKSGEWLRVDSLFGNPSDGKAYLIGPGIGYDVHRLVVFAYDSSSAYEIAEEKAPHLMYDEISKEEAEDDESAVPLSRHGQYFASGWGRPSEDVRILERVRVEKARVVGYGEAALKNGSVVRYQ